MENGRKSALEAIKWELREREEKDWDLLVISETVNCLTHSEQAWRPTKEGRALFNNVVHSSCTLDVVNGAKIGILDAFY